MAEQATPGIRAISPSYGASDTLTTAPSALADLHRKLAPFLLVRSGMPAPAEGLGRLAPPQPYTPALIDQGVTEAERDLDGAVSFPEQLFTLSTKYRAIFTAVAANPDLTDAGRARQRDATAAELVAGVTVVTTRVVSFLQRAADGWVDQARDPGRSLLLGKGVPPGIMQLALLTALAPVPFVIALLEQLTPQAPDDLGDQLSRENVAAVLALRKAEWSAVPRTAERALAAFRRAQAKDRTPEFYGGLYVSQRVDRMAREWNAAVSFVLQHGYLDPGLQPPLSLAFARPDADAARALVIAALPQDDADVLEAFGLRFADPSGLPPRSSESAGPLRLDDKGSRPT